MKKTITIFVCILTLLSIKANATDRNYYKLGKGSMVFVNALNIIRCTELTSSPGNVATEYFDDLVTRKLALQTNKDLIVYKFDHFVAVEGIDVFRVKLRNDTIVESIDTTNGTISNVRFPAGAVLGWVFGISLKKAK
jgi:hypothetical protein